MARNKHTSPSIEVTITAENRERAVRSNSGSCLIADAIKREHPEFTGVSVDMATIRVTDRVRGERYIYLTPPAAQQVLLSFDQGWPGGEQTLTLKRAVQIIPLKSSRPKIAHRRARLAELETKEADGTLTRSDKAALTRMRQTPERPLTSGPAEVRIDRETGNKPVVRGGVSPRQGPDHPNLLRGTNRHFGTKLADPGLAFREALEAELALRLGSETP